MLTRLTAFQFDRRATRGRTQPIFLTCHNPNGAEIEVVAKLSARCDEKAVNLAREVIAACLAGDLGLPIPEPYLVELPPEWVASVTDAEVQGALRASAPVAFGSRLAGAQFGVWTPTTALRPPMLATALAVFVFDAIIQNPDRRAENPNCLVRGDEIRIFDHELAFTHHLVIPRRLPWQAGAMQALTAPGRHIFRDKLRKESLDFAPVRAAWMALSDMRIEGYAAAIPAEWDGVGTNVNAAVQLIKDARDHIEACIVEIRRVLT